MNDSQTPATPTQHEAIGRHDVVIDVRHICKSYGELIAVDDVSLTVFGGEVIGVLGPNGAGKTTLLEMIEGLRAPDSGVAFVMGHPTWPRNRRALRHIGVQLQASAFFDGLNVREQLLAFADLHRAPRSRVPELLNQVGLTDKAKESTAHLSGGQRQRLAIATTLVHDPDIVFLDEPSAGLDALGRRSLWDIILTIRESGKTVVLTTHHLDEAEALCDRVAILHEGRMLTVDTPANVIRRMDAPVRVVVDRSAVTADAARRLAGALSVSENEREILIETRDAAGVIASLAPLGSLHGLRIEGARLEDAFLSLTRSGR